MADKNDALVPSDDLANMIVSERPSGADEGYLGNEGISHDDLMIPRIGLAQKMSPEIDTTSSRYIDGLRFMDLFNSMSKQIYGQGPLQFVILRRYDPRWVEFNPIDEGGGIKDRNVPKGDARTEFGPNGEKPIATTFYDFLVLLLNDLNMTEPMQNIVALSLKSSAIKAAKHLNMLITQRGSKKLCKGVYEVRTGYEVDKKSNGTYAIYKFKNAGWLKPGSPLEQLALEAFKAWQDREVKIDLETVDDDASFDTATMEAEAR